MALDEKTGFNRYTQAVVAGQFYQRKEGNHYVNASLNLLRQNLKFGEDGERYFPSEELQSEDEYVRDSAIKKVISIEYKNFQEKLNASKMEEVYAWLKPALSQLGTEDTYNIENAFKNTGGRTYGQVMEEIEEAEQTINYHKASEAEKKKAKETLEQYRILKSGLEILEAYAIDEERAKAIELSKQPMKKNILSNAKGIYGKDLESRLNQIML